MSKKDKEISTEQLMDAVVHMNLAHSAAMMTLVRTLEQAGVMTAEDYGHNLRLASEAMASRGQVGAAGLLDDLADLMSREEKTQQ
ncbi:hypothetical protein J2T08_002986 [Neorhizobium galegae]|uniref:hypothetical protein n=1 Tax=Neorhizobium galegae TaxID=399 RepID=UPI0027816425|nr:hypothetical protein [Neorhizobium galegae]MDQ0135065.1 hypothetical protein [Neorhizobium galegae]